MPEGSSPFSPYEQNQSPDNIYKHNPGVIGQGH